MPVCELYYIWIILSLFYVPKLSSSYNITYLGSFQFWPAMKVWNLCSSELSKNISTYMYPNFKLAWCDAHFMYTSNLLISLTLWNYNTAHTVQPIQSLSTSNSTISVRAEIAANMWTGQISKRQLVPQDCRDNPTKKMSCCMSNNLWIVKEKKTVRN